jgi:hypothetical protein
MKNDLTNFSVNATADSKSGVNVRDTAQLKGEATDSLSGKNTTEVYEPSAQDSGKLGGPSDNYK